MGDHQEEGFVRGAVGVESCRYVDVVVVFLHVDVAEDCLHAGMMAADFLTVLKEDEVVDSTVPDVMKKLALLCLGRIFGTGIVFVVFGAPHFRAFYTRFCFDRRNGLKSIRCFNHYFLCMKAE